MKNFIYLFILPLSVNLFAQTPTQAIHALPEQRFNISDTILSTNQPSPSITPASTNSVPALSEQDLLANPPLLYRALSSSVVFNNIVAIRQLLPLYLSLPSKQQVNDALLVESAKAALALADGQYQQAVHHYRQVLAINPNLPTMRLLLAQALFHDYQNDAAQDQFIRLRSEPNLPAHIVQLIESYQTALNERQQWRISGGISYIQDNNVNNAANATLKTTNGYWRSPKPERAQGLSYHVHAERDWAIKHHFALRTGVQLSGKFYWNNHSYDDLSTRINIGGVYKTARTEFAVLPYFERRWYGTEPYSREQGLRGEWSYWLSPRNKTLLAIEKGHAQYDHRNYLNGNNLTVSGSWLFLQKPTQYWIMGADYSRKNAQDNSLAFERQALRLGWTREWKWGLSSSVYTTMASHRYQHADIFNIQRHDKELSASLSLWHRNIHFWGITPRLVGTYHKNRSNNPLYQYQKNNVFMQFNKVF